MANGLVFITSTSFTTQASVSIDGCFSATYTHYLVKRNLLGSSANLDLDVRLRVSATDATGADYRSQALTANSTTVGGQRLTGLTRWSVAFGYTEATAIGYAELWISNPFEAVRTTAWVDRTYGTPGSIEVHSAVHAHDLATSYDGITVYPASGTITGSISVWGLVKA